MKYLPTEIAATVEQHDLIVFDGECVLCSGFCRVMLKHDRQNCFAYATAQSALGTRPNLALGLPTAFYKTNLVIVDGRLF